MGSCNMANPTTSHPQWGFIQFILGYSPIFMIYNDALLLEIWSHPSLIFIHTTSNSLGENGTWLLRDFHQKNHVLGATWPRNTHQKLVWGKAKLLLFFWAGFLLFATILNNFFSIPTFVGKLATCLFYHFGLRNSDIIIGQDLAYFFDTPWPIHFFLVNAFLALVNTQSAWRLLGLERFDAIGPLDSLAQSLRLFLGQNVRNWNQRSKFSKILGRTSDDFWVAGFPSTFISQDKLDPYGSLVGPGYRIGIGGWATDGAAEGSRCRTAPRVCAPCSACQPRQSNRPDFFCRFGSHTNLGLVSKAVYIPFHFWV